MNRVKCTIPRPDAFARPPHSLYVSRPYLPEMARGGRRKKPRPKLVKKQTPRHGRGRKKAPSLVFRNAISTSHTPAMSRLPSLVAQARERTAPPPVPPLLDRSQFDSDEAHSEYMRTRRKAQERLREFNRPPRYRTSRVRLKPTAPTEATKRLANAAEMLRERERRIHFGCGVETGRKNRAPMSVWQPPPRGNAHEQWIKHASTLPTLTSAAKVHAALVQQDDWVGVSHSQVRRAITEANKARLPEAVEEDRRDRRSIRKNLSATRPAAYPASLAHKRAKREARRPQLEERRLERARKKLCRAKAVATAQWAYDTCLAEECRAREHDADDLWYLKERRLDAGSALRIARGANESPRWECAESGIGPLTLLEKFGSEADWINRACCPTCDKRIHRCKCEVNDCSNCGKQLRR